MEDFNAIQTHEHDGRGSRKLSAKNLKNAPQPVLTAQSGSIGTSNAEGGTYITGASATAINNAITRIAELEDRLEKLELIKSN